jgi:hypothetical protein
MRLTRNLRAWRRARARLIADREAGRGKSISSRLPDEALGSPFSHLDGVMRPSRAPVPRFPPE